VPPDLTPTPEYLKCRRSMKCFGKLKPEEIEMLESSINKIDVFQLGLVLLEVATYKPTSLLWSLEEGFI